MTNRCHAAAPLVLALVAGVLAGCSTAPPRPLVDPGRSRGSYEADVADCQLLAEERPVSAAAAGGATVGAVLGALLGVAVGLRGEDVGHLAAWGAVNGGLEGAGYGTAEQRAIVARCMEGRGYDVIAD